MWEGLEGELVLGLVSRVVLLQVLIRFHSTRMTRVYEFDHCFDLGCNLVSTFTSWKIGETFVNPFIHPPTSPSLSFWGLNHVRQSLYY